MQHLIRWASKVATAIAAHGPGLIKDAMGFTGLVLLAYGAGLVYRPAEFLVGGLELVAFAWLLAKAGW